MTNVTLKIENNTESSDTPETFTHSIYVTDRNCKILVVDELGNPVEPRRYGDYKTPLQVRNGDRIQIVTYETDNPYPHHATVKCFVSTDNMTTWNELIRKPKVRKGKHKKPTYLIGRKGISYPSNKRF